MTEKINEILAETWPELKGKELSEEEEIFLLKVDVARKDSKKADQTTSAKTVDDLFLATYGEMIESMKKPDMTEKELEEFEANVKMLKDAFVMEQSEANTPAEEIPVNKTPDEIFQETYGDMLQGMDEKDIEALKDAFTEDLKKADSASKTDMSLVKANTNEENVERYEPILSSATDLLHVYNILHKDFSRLNEEMLKNVDMNTDLSNSSLNTYQETNYDYMWKLQTFFANDLLDRGSTSADIVIEEIHRTGSAKGLKSILETNPEIQQMMNVLEAKAETSLGMFTGKSWEKLSADEQKSLMDIAKENPKEMIILAHGCKDCKIFGIGDLKAKIESPEVKAKAKEVLATDLTPSIKRLAEHPLEGMDKKLGIGGEFKEDLSLNLSAARQARA